MRVRASRSARRELREASDWYRERSPGSAPRFRESYLDAMRRVREYPASGPAFVFRTRRMLLDGFPYALIYEVRAEEVLIIAVAHTSRRPGYWRPREDE